MLSVSLQVGRVREVGVSFIPTGCYAGLRLARGLARCSEVILSGPDESEVGMSFVSRELCCTGRRKLLTSCL